MRMNTQSLPVEEGLPQAAALLQEGQVVAIPTETVYGLAANAFDKDAVERIFVAKGRPQDNPLIVHIASEEMIPTVVREFPEMAKRLAAAFWPGPLTLVLPKSDAMAPNVTAGLDTVGLRWPAHEGAQAVILAAGLPLAAPSANLSGSPSPTSAAHVYADLAGRIPLILDGGQAPVGVESTVLSLCGTPTILRPGFTTREELEEVLEQPVELAVEVEQPLPKDVAPQSPGTKYKHYAPKAKITIINSTIKNYIDYISSIASQDKAVFAMCFEEEQALVPVPGVTFGRRDDAASQAQALFGALRRLDEMGAEVVYARAPDARGVGLAVRNRLLRAAGFREIYP